MSNIHKKLSAAGVLITLGIVFGDIGTSPLYVLKAIVGNREISESLVLGGLSCVFWTLTIQTTLKYIILTLQADNHGEGGIFSLYALVRRHVKWVYFPAFIGAGTLLTDGIITPPISVSAAIEGLNKINPNIPVIPIVIAIITLLFLYQRLGTKIVGSSFGPIMIVWFSMIAVLGLSKLIHMPHVLYALNPVYAIELLVQYPSGFWLLGAVFLATTGAEALYSDLGHCGRKNIRVAWIFVKISLLLNYFGQGAWLLSRGDKSLVGASGEVLNPFYEIMPHWFLLIGIIIATIAAVIASQALISGSFTLISEAVSLNFWPRVSIKFPTVVKGQLFIPSINAILWTGCVATVLYFQKSDNMEAAYGFSISVAMLMTTWLMTYYLIYIRKMKIWLVSVFLLLFLSVEGCFFIANAVKLQNAWPFLFIVFSIVFIMYIWYRARKITNRFIEFISLDDYTQKLIGLSNDQSIPKYASHLIYLTKANFRHEIEQRIMYSIFSRNPKRADIYWFVHIDRTDEPYTMEYTVEELVNDKVIRVDFKLGFRIQPRVNVFFRKVVEELVASKELDITSRYESLGRYKLQADFKFVILETFLSVENEFAVKEGLILNTYFFVKQLAQPDTRAFGLDTSDVVIEKIPIVISPVTNIQLRRRALKNVK